MIILLKKTIKLNISNFLKKTLKIKILAFNYKLLDNPIVIGCKYKVVRTRT